MIGYQPDKETKTRIRQLRTYSIYIYKYIYTLVLVTYQKICVRIFVQHRAATVPGTGFAAPYGAYFDGQTLASVIRALLFRYEF